MDADAFSAVRINLGSLAFLASLLLLATHDAHAGALLNDVREQNGFILAELAEGAFTPEHLLDLDGRTLTITPDGAGGFDLQSGPLQWDADFGQRVDAGSDGFPSTPVTLEEFAFPFAGSTWDQVFVNAFGSVSFGGVQQEFFFDADLDGGDGSLRTFGNTIIQRGVPVIAPLFHFIYDQSDDIFVRQEADALLVTWSISETHGDIFAFAAKPRINEFQLRLESDGTMRISYKKLELRDGLVGVFAPPECNSTDLLTSFPDATGDTAAGHIDITNASVEAVDQCSLRFTFTFREDLLDEGNPELAEVLYRVWIDMEEPFFEGNPFDDAEFNAGVGTDGDLAYTPSNQGVELVSHTGNELVYDLDLSRLEGNTDVAVFFDAADFANEELNTTESASIMPEAGKQLPGHVRQAFDGYLQCGRLEHGFLRLRRPAHGRWRRLAGRSSIAGAADPAMGVEPSVSFTVPAGHASVAERADARDCLTAVQVVSPSESSRLRQQCPLHLPDQFFELVQQRIAARCSAGVRSSSRARLTYLAPRLRRAGVIRAR